MTVANQHLKLKMDYKLELKIIRYKHIKYQYKNT